MTTQFEFTLPSAECTINIARTMQLSIDMDMLTDPVKGFIFMYGIRQLLNDAGASEKSPDAKYEAAEDKLARLYEGIVGRVAGSSLPPVEREIQRLATEYVHVAVRKAHKTVKAYLAMSDANKEKLAAAITAYATKHDATLRPLAEEAVRKAKEQQSNVDLDDLGL